MANIKSAKKRINTIKRQRTENKLVKSELGTEIKKYKKMLTANELAAAESQLKKIISMLDSACSKGVFHKNNVARKQSRLTIAFNKVKANVATLAAAEKETAAAAKNETVEETVAETVETNKPKTTAKKASSKPATKTAAKTTTTKTAK